MQIKTQLIPAGTLKRPGTKISGLLGITIHQTGNTGAGANAQAHASYVNRTCNESYDSYHYVVDDHQIIQLIPEDEIAWHAGDGATGPGNTRTIAIEICVNSDGDMRKAADNAAWLAADIARRKGLGISRIYQHNHWSGKDCPMQIRRGQPYDWATFVRKVEAGMKPAPAAKPAEIKDGGKGAVYRLANPNNGDRIYTTNLAEARNVQKAGWNFERIGWHAPAKGAPVYRLYDGKKKHLFTLNAGEKAALVKAGWKDEGIAFCSGGNNPIYRMYNPNGGQHVLTESRAEHDMLTKAGWQCEGQDIKF